MEDLFKANILSFINPHFFWFIKNKDATERHKLEKKLKAALTNPIKTNVVLEKNVAVYDSIWKRAIIKSQNQGILCCWLKDYGVLFNTKEVYELPECFQNEPLPLAKQACLYDIIPLKLNLSKEDLKVTYMESNSFSDGTFNTILEYFKKTLNVLVECKMVHDEIYYVQLLIETTSGNYVDLEKVLLEKNFATKNKCLFNKVMSGLKLTANDLIELFEKKSVLTEQSLNGQETFQGGLNIRACRIAKNICNKNKDKINISDTISGSSHSFTDGHEENSKTDVNISKANQDDIQDTTDETDHKQYYTSESKVITSEESSTSRDRLCEESSKTRDSISEESFTREVVRKNLFLGLYPDSSFFTSNKKSKVKYNSKSLNNRCHDRTSPTNISKDSSHESFTYKRSIPKNVLREATEIETSSSSSSSNEEFVDDIFKKMMKEKQINNDMNNKKTDCVKNTIPKDSELTFNPDSRCKCKNCKSLALDATSWFDDVLTFNGSEEKFAKEVVKPVSFLKRDSEKAGKYAVQTLVSHQNYTKIQREYLPPVLVHGFPISNSAKYVSDVPFHCAVQNALSKLKIVKCKHIQSYTWPVLLNNLNVCAISGPKSGKTLMYLPCMATIVLENTDVFKKLPNSTGPTIIIMCAGMKSAEKAYFALNILLENCKRPLNVALSVTPFDNDCLDQFKKRCDVLITTPLTLQHLLVHRIINLKRLCHIVFDDFDKILNKFYKEINRLLEVIQSVVEHRTCEVCVQYVITAENWTKKLETIVKKFHVPPFICIGAHFEAALYGKMKFDVKFTQSVKKEKELLVLVKENSQVKKTIIVCDDDEEVADVTKYLQINGLSVLEVKSDLTRLDIEEHELSWINSSNGEYLVLVCTDVMFNNSSIRDADILINYSLPCSWTAFTDRYKVSLDKYSSTVYDINDTGNCISYVFIDEKSEKKTARFISFLQMMGFSVPQKFIKYQKDYFSNEERAKCENGTYLCNELSVFGRCKKLKCSKRHLVYKDVDVIERLPQRGSVKFKIVTVHDPVHYTIKLIGDNSDSGCIQDDLLKALNERKVYADGIKQGDLLLYVQDVKSRQYERCEVLKVLKTDLITKTASSLKIRLLESGKVFEVSNSTLFELPEKFKEIPPEGTEMYLANILPPFSDTNFSNHSINIMKKRINRDKHNIFTGIVLLQLGNTLWMENVHTIKHLAMYNLEVSGFNLNKFVVEQNLAEKCSEPLLLLYELCETANIAVPKFEEKQQTSEKKHQSQHFVPQWAFLNKQIYEEVWITHIQTPELFYVHLDKFKNLLKSLEKDIAKTVRSPLSKCADNIILGQYCIAKLGKTNSNCRRVKVVHVESRIVKCFCVDYGNNILVKKSDIYPIKNEMISKLPFQAIQCRLFGITAVNEWTQNDSKILWELCGDSASLKSLYAWAEKIENIPSEEGLLKYSVFLSKDGSEYTFNQLLEEMGVAQRLESENYTIDCDDSSADTRSYSSRSDAECSEEDNTKLDPALLLPDVITPEYILEWGKKHGVNDEDLEKYDFYHCCLDDNNVIPVKNKPCKKESNVSKPENDFLPMKALPNVDYCTPTVHWYQADASIVIKIQLIDIKEYNLQLYRKRVLKFSTNCKGKKYELNLMLFNTVKKEPTHSVTGTYVKVALIKENLVKWPRLVTTKDRMRHICYDPLHLSDDDDDDEDDKIKIFKKMQAIKTDNDEDNGDFLYELCDTTSDSDQEKSEFSDQEDLDV